MHMRQLFVDLEALSISYKIYILCIIFCLVELNLKHFQGIVLLKLGAILLQQSL